jgi:hypothetical protein
MSTINPLDTTSSTWQSQATAGTQAPPRGAKPPGPPPDLTSNSEVSSWLESKLGSSDKVSELQSDIQSAMTEALKNGGSESDVHTAVDGVLQKYGIDPTEFKQELDSVMGASTHRGYDSRGQAVAGGGAQVSTTASTSLMSLISLDTERHTQA